MTGLIVLVGVLVVATAYGVLARRRSGRVRTPADTGERLTAAEVGEQLGDRATLVQFSSAFCAPCRATRVILADVAAHAEGVAHVEIDAESHLDLVRRLHIMKTPTTLVLDAEGRVRGRASGQPRREQVLAALTPLAAASNGSVS
jgi:thiol-disulfide isomerase/thioredoxin